MITELLAEHFQSIRRVRVQLGGLTVVTGPTGSGKSSLIRALRLLAFNARGTAYISQGAAKCSVAAAGEDSGIAQPGNAAGVWCVSLERGGRGADAYRAAVPAEEARTYTKLAGGVPEDISGILSLSDINFAGQFESPYLLTATAGETARSLGELTSVTLLFSAAREAARRKKAIQAEMRAATAEAARLAEDAKRFSGLRERLCAVTEAEEALKRVQEAEVMAARLRVLLDGHSAALTVLGKAASAVVEGPDLSVLLGLREKYERLCSLAGTVSAGQAQVRERDKQAVAEWDSFHKAEHDLRKSLFDAGQCPVCGSVISGGEMADASL